MKRKYVNPKNCIVDLKLEELLCTSPVDISINRENPYEGNGAVEVRSQNTSFDWDNSEW